MRQGTRFPQAATNDVGSAANGEQQNSDHDGACGQLSTTESAENKSMRLQVQVPYECKREDEV